MKPERARSRFLEQSDAPGVINVNGNYSGAGVGAKVFSATVPAGEVWQLQRLIGYIQDGGQMNPNEYGDLGVALTNGIGLHVHDETGAMVLDITGGEPVKTNGEWAAFCFDVNNYGAAVSGSDAYGFRWTFSRDYGEALTIPEGYSFELHVSDDLSGLTRHTFRLAARVAPWVAI